MISEERKKQFKKRLEEAKASLSEEIKKLETPVDMGDFPGPDDETDESVQSYNQRSAAASLRKELTEVNLALLKMEKGTYGICEKCKQPIEEKVLDIAPDARFCRECNKVNIKKK
jgi:DnaK suppressor protein